MPAALAVNDFFDFSVYVDAETGTSERWYVERFLRLRETAFRDPDSYFRRYAELDRRGRGGPRGAIWHEINGPNLVRTSCRPAAGRPWSSQGAGPHITRVRLRKL